MVLYQRVFVPDFTLNYILCDFAEPCHIYYDVFAVSTKSANCQANKYPVKCQEQPLLKVSRLITHHSWPGPRGHLGPKRAQLGPRLGHLGPRLGQLGPMLGHLRPKLGHLSPSSLFHYKVIIPLWPHYSIMRSLFHYERIILLQAHYSFTNPYVRILKDTLDSFEILQWVQGVLALCEFHYCEFHYCGFSKLLLKFG